MSLASIDWAIIISFFAISLGIGLYAARSAGKSAQNFFLSGKNMPWWLLGVSMVATTFAADTPNLVTDIVRQNGVSGNWVWWAFLLTGMLTVFIYAKLWQKSNVMTDIEFYELRYSGKMAKFLRGFRAMYLGVLLNVLIMASVTLAMIKIAAVLLHWSREETIYYGLGLTLIYSAFGGLRGVILTDFFQFIIAMVGSIGAAIYVVNLPEVGGLDGLFSAEAVQAKQAIFPDFTNLDELVPLLILPLAVQWWSVWYPGAEPGGGGYVAQRMLSAKTQKDSMIATLLFNGAHYALRPWPWILVALASLIVYPSIADLTAAFPNVDPNLIKHDFAYPAMLSLLPKGLLGLVVASLVAAFMSTISTHLNWGSSYVVNDVYKRFISPDASEKTLVAIGRISMILMTILTAIVVLFLDSAKQAFDILILLGAGTGLIFILRWFWWRVNAYAEFVAMTVSFLIALFFRFGPNVFGFEPFSNAWQLILGVGITTVSWIVTCYVTPDTAADVLKNFYQKIQPGGWGWKKIVHQLNIKENTGDWYVPVGILCMISGCFMIYGLLFATGYLIYGNMLGFFLAALLSATAGGLVFKLWKKLQIDH
jgi:Na+/proline symporter